MKTRNDFISNSSSCSFLVQEPAKAIKLFKEEFKKCLSSMPYNDIVFVLYGTYDGLEKIKTALGYGDLNKAYDEMFSLSEISLQGLIEVPMKLWKNVWSMDILCEDHKDGDVMFVRLLRQFFDKNGIKTKDDGDCDSGIDNNDFMSALMKKAMS